MQVKDPLSIIDRIVADLIALKEALTELPSPVIPAIEEDDLVDTSTAAERFDLPHDTVRWLCRAKAMGEKRGGRWMISLSALQAYKREKRE